MVSLILAAFCVVLAAIYFAATQALPNFFLSDPLGHRAFPYLLTGGLVVCSLMLIWEGLSHRRAGTAGDSKVPQSLDMSETNPAFFAGAVAWIGLYFFLFNILGFIVATTIFLGGFFALTHRKKWRTSVIVAIVVPIGMFVLLRYVFSLPLPLGILSFIR